MPGERDHSNCQDFEGETIARQVHRPPLSTKMHPPPGRRLVVAGQSKKNLTI